MHKKKKQNEKIKETNSSDNLCASFLSIQQSESLKLLVQNCDTVGTNDSVLLLPETARI